MCSNLYSCDKGDGRLLGQILDYRLPISSFCLQLFRSVRRIGVCPCQSRSLLNIYRNFGLYRCGTKKNLKWKLCKRVGCYSTLAIAIMGPVNVKSQPSFWGRDVNDTDRQSDLTITLRLLFRGLF